MRWPGGGVAVSVEAEAGTPLGFRIGVNFRRGARIAAAFDAHGAGFAYRHDGSIVLQHSPARGGCLFDRQGAAVDTWAAAPPRRLIVPLSESFALVLEPGAQSANRGDGDGGDGGGDGDGSSHDGSRGRSSQGRVCVLFKCDGVSHMLVHGPNPQRPCWRADLDGEPLLANLGVARPSAAPRSTRLPPAPGMAAGGPTSIQDALALLPDLGIPRRPRS